MTLSSHGQRRLKIKYCFFS